MEDIASARARALRPARPSPKRCRLSVPQARTIRRQGVPTAGSQCGGHSHAEPAGDKDLHPVVEAGDRSRAKEQGEGEPPSTTGSQGVARASTPTAKSAGPVAEKTRSDVRRSSAPAASPLATDPSPWTGVRTPAKAGERWSPTSSMA